jgi:cell division initiation protein
MPLTPVEIRHLPLKRGLFGYRRAAVHTVMDEIAESFEGVWRDRSQLAERVEELEKEVARHVELEGLLRSTLVAAERASQEMKEQARREADVIVVEANAESRRIVRDAIGQKESLMSDVRRVQALLRSALAAVEEGTPASGVAPGGTPASRPPLEASSASEPSEDEEPGEPGVRKLAG